MLTKTQSKPLIDADHPIILTLKLMNCLYCNQALMPEHINIRKDTAVCASCNSLFSIAQDYDRQESSAFDINNPPQGSWIRYQDDKIILGSTIRSSASLMTIPFIFLWCGGSVGRILGGKLLTGDLGGSGWVIIVQLILEVMFFVSFVSMALSGKVEVTVDKEVGRIFVGVWKIGWNKKVYWSNVDCIKEMGLGPQNSTSCNGIILLEGKTRIYFGALLSEVRRYYLYRSLKQALFRVRRKRSLPALHL